MNKTLTFNFAIEIRTHPYTAEREVKQTADGWLKCDWQKFSEDLIKVL